MAGATCAEVWGKGPEKTDRAGSRSPGPLSPDTRWLRSTAWVLPHPAIPRALLGHSPASPGPPGSGTPGSAADHSQPVPVSTPSGTFFMVQRAPTHPSSPTVGIASSRKPPPGTVTMAVFPTWAVSSGLPLTWPGQGGLRAVVSLWVASLPLVPPSIHWLEVSTSGAESGTDCSWP